MTASLLAFIPVALLLTLIPGADTALVTRNALALGLQGARWTILGILTGCLIHATASALGLSAILATSARAYETVKLVGAAYLVWIGIQTIRNAKSGADGHSSTPGLRPSAPNDGEHPFMQGFLTNILNPKVALFYLTFLPQFIDPSGSVLAQSLLFAVAHSVMGILWLALYAYVLARLSIFFARAGVRRWLERVTGAVLIGLGVRLAFERR